MKCFDCGEEMVDKGTRGYSMLSPEGKVEHLTDHKWFCSKHGIHTEQDCRCDNSCKQNRLHAETKHECSKCGKRTGCNETHGDKKVRHNCKVA